jgi:site-specific DNA recombinase
MRAVGYGRVSTEEQANEGHSLDAQRERNLKRIQEEGWTLVGYFDDPGYSGKNLKRPGIQKLIAEIEQGNIDAVVVHKLDRLTRNVGDLHKLMKLFEKHNIKFISVTEHLDTSSAMGRMFVFMLGIIAQWYRENLSEEVKKGMSTRAKKGLHNITVPLFGYERAEDGKLIVKPDEAKWVRWIFDQYLAGIGSTNIAKRLNEMGVRRNRGAKWDQHKVMMTLTNWHYVGRVHWKDASKPDDERIIVDGSHEPIISVETFEAAQRLLERRKAGMASKTSYDYVFSGIIRCGKCGGNYKGKYNKKRGNQLYRGYECTNNAKYGTCDQSGISERNLTKLIFNSIHLIPELLSWDDKQEPSTEREEILRQLQQSEMRRNRWQMAFGDGNMPYEDFAKLMREEMERAAELEKRLTELPTATPSSISADEAREILNQLEQNWDMLSQTTRKQVVQSVFKSITIRKDDAWSITQIILA